VYPGGQASARVQARDAQAHFSADSANGA
jgi:hypothetical protein